MKGEKFTLLCADDRVIFFHNLLIKIELIKSSVNGIGVAYTGWTPVYEERCLMSEVAFILLSAFFLAIPVVIKYTIAFQTRSMLNQLRSQERIVHTLSLQLEGVQSEKVAVRRALSQVHTQRRQADARRQLQEEQLQHVRSLAQSVPSRRRRTVADKSAAPTLEMPQLEEVIDVDETVETAA